MARKRKSEGKTKGGAAKYVQMAAQLKRARRNSIIQLIAALIVGVAFWVFISFSGINDHTVVTSVFIFGATVIVVFAVGLVGNKVASNNTELNKLKNEYGVTEEQIAEYLAKH